MIQTYIDHCLWMAERDPRYAALASKGYARLLHAPEISRQVIDTLMEAAP